MKKFIIGASLAAIVTIPAIAIAQADKPEHRWPETRAEVQAQVAERFGKMDANKDGAVTRAEFDAVRAKMKAERDARRTERREEMFAKLDADKSGQLSKAEFAARPDRPEGMGKPGDDRGPGMRGHGHHGGKHRGHGGMGMGMGGPGGGDWFDRLDVNKDGKVTLAEATAKPLALFDKADANKDGKVTPEERKAAFETMRAEWKAKRG